jgi:hypothetical protein
VRVLLFPVVFVLPACSQPPPEPITPRAVVASAPPVVATATPSAGTTPPPLPPCSIDPLPVFASPAPPGACVPVPAKQAAGARAKLTKRYTPGAPHAEISVTFACDPLAGPPIEVVFEYGSGHGQDLALVRLSRRGDTLEALRLQRPSYFTHPGSLFEAERAAVPAAALDALLPAVRALVLAKLEERVPEDEAGRSGFFSSGDFHGLVRLTDAKGHVIERAFTGYPSSEEQLQSMPMTEIEELLYPLVDHLRWEPVPLDTGARAFFVWRYLAAGLEPPGRAAWWVRERLVMMAESAGTSALIPSLVALATATGNDASMDRTREEAVASLAVLAGFDLRKDARGEPRPIADAAADYARACRR